MSGFLQRIRIQLSPCRCSQIRSLTRQSFKESSNRVIIDTPSGKLRGTSHTSCLGDEYYAFKGIPYAKPPVGQLRFHDPQPIDSWPNVRDATSHSSISYQYEYATDKVVGSEDCLYLNVYTRDLNGRAPVMVWIHGGAYHSMSANDDVYGPDYLISRDVILLTFNYRLGIFGFLNLQHEVAPGNQGLKDQLLLLKWVKSHIASFGGDPRNVTLFGFSAGASSIHCLHASPSSRGLFDRAICQSATAACAWSSPEDSEGTLCRYLDELGCRERDPKKTLEYLRKVDARKLIEVQQILCSPMDWFRSSLPFFPRIDDKFDDPALPGITPGAIERGMQVPLILGANSSEGMNYYDFLRHLDLADVDRNLQRYLHRRILKTLKHHNMSVEDLRKMYFDGGEISERNVEKVLKMCGDFYGNCDIRHLAKIQMSENSAVPTYHYRFSFDKNLTVYKKQRRYPFTGAYHGEELTYLFRMNVCDALNLEQLQEGTGAERVMRQMVEMWTNFAKTGKPIPEKSTLLPVDWQPLSKGSPVDCLDIGEELTMTKILDVEKPYPGGTLF